MACAECEVHACLFVGMILDAVRMDGWPPDDAAPLPAAWWHNDKRSDPHNG